MSTVTTVPIVNISIGKFVSRLSKLADDLRNVGLTAKADSATDLWAIADFTDNEALKNYFVSTTTSSADTAIEGLQVDASTLAGFFQTLKNYCASFDGINDVDTFLTDQSMMVTENFADIYYESVGKRLSRTNVLPSRDKKATTTTYSNVLGSITSGVASSATAATLSSNVSAYYPIQAVFNDADISASVSATATLYLNSTGSATLASKTIFDSDESKRDTLKNPPPVGMTEIDVDSGRFASGTIDFSAGTSFSETKDNTALYAYFASSDTNYVPYVYIIGTVDDAVGTSDMVVGQKLAISGADFSEYELTYATANLLYTFASGSTVYVYPMYYGYSSLSPSGSDSDTISIRPFTPIPETYSPTLGADTVGAANDYNDIVTFD